MGFQPDIGEVEKKVAEFLGVSVKDVEDISLSLEEIQAFLVDKIHQIRNTESLIRAFHLFDIENKNNIQLKDIKRVSKEVGMPLTDNEAGMILENLDANGGGDIDMDEWQQILRVNVTMNPAAQQKKWMEQPKI